MQVKSQGKYIKALRMDLKTDRDDATLMDTSVSFQSSGPATAKAQSHLRFNLDLGTESNPRPPDLSNMDGLCELSTSDRYSTAWSFSDFKTNNF